VCFIVAILPYRGLLENQLLVFPTFDILQLKLLMICGRERMILTQLLGKLEFIE
jgi:hypothetical protein